MPKPKLYTFTCRYPACRKVFKTDNPFLRYCNPTCRVKHRKDQVWWSASAEARITRSIPGRATPHSEMFGEDYGPDSVEKG